MNALPHNPARIAIEAGTEVLRRPAYLLLAGTIALVALAAALWLPNYRLLAAVFATPGVPLDTVLRLAASLLGGLATNYGVVAAISLVTVPVLFGVDIAMIAYFVRLRRARLARGELAASVGGAASGAIAAGCAACGSFLLLPVLSFIGAAGALALLPLGGAELGLLSIGLLLVSIYLVARKIAVPSTCELPRGGPVQSAGHESQTPPAGSPP